MYAVNVEFERVAGEVLHGGIISGYCSGASVDVYRPKNTVERVSDRTQALDQVSTSILFRSTD